MLYYTNISEKILIKDTMAENTLLDKVWNLHKVHELPSGEDQLFIGLHLIHEVTSPQAFQMIQEKGLPVKYPSRTFATIDHIVPTHTAERPFSDDMAENMMKELETNTKKFGISFFNHQTNKQGIVHVIGPELGLTQPGMTIACGDSHTSTHGAFGSIGFGIGTSQVRDVFATQCISIKKPKIQKIQVNGTLQNGVYVKDIILAIISELGVMGGIGFAYEYTGTAIEQLSMEERMTICNMSIEGGARVGYINPDETTFAYMQGRPYTPKREEFELAKKYWKGIASTSSSKYDEIFSLDANSLSPMLTWGITPGQAIPINESTPVLDNLDEDTKLLTEKALQHMKFKEKETLLGKKIDVAFIGSCTNGRLSDLREAAEILQNKKIHSDVHAFVVPGSQQVAKAAESEGLDEVFKSSGFEWRSSGCSICLGMNTDKLQGNELCVNSSNRNFTRRQGSPTGRTILSPAMVAKAAIYGKIEDIRNIL